MKKSSQENRNNSVYSLGNFQSQKGSLIPNPNRTKLSNPLLILNC